MAMLTPASWADPQVAFADNQEPLLSGVGERRRNRCCAGLKRCLLWPLGGEAAKTVLKMGEVRWAVFLTPC